MLTAKARENFRGTDEARDKPLSSSACICVHPRFHSSRPLRAHFAPFAPSGSLPARLSKTFFTPRAKKIPRARAIVSPRFSPHRARLARSRADKPRAQNQPPVNKKPLTRIFPITKLAHEKGGDASAMAKKAAKKSSKKTTKKTTKKK